MSRLFAFVILIIGFVVTGLAIFLGYESLWPVITDPAFTLDALMFALLSVIYIPGLLIAGIFFLFMGFVVNTLCDIRYNTRQRRS